MTEMPEVESTADLEIIIPPGMERLAERAGYAPAKSDERRRWRLSRTLKPSSRRAGRICAVSSPPAAVRSTTSST